MLAFPRCFGVFISVILLWCHKFKDSKLAKCVDVETEKSFWRAFLGFCNLSYFSKLLQSLLHFFILSSLIKRHEQTTIRVFIGPTLISWTNNFQVCSHSPLIIRCSFFSSRSDVFSLFEIFFNYIRWSHIQLLL